MVAPLLRGRSGFTLIEVMVALVILSVVLLGMGATIGGLLHTATSSDWNTAAQQLAEDRIEQVRLEPSYAALDTLYAGTESTFPGLSGWTRDTEIVHFGGTGQSVDYKKVTVTVSGPGLRVPIARTVTVAAP